MKQLLASNGKAVAQSLTDAKRAMAQTQKKPEVERAGARKQLAEAKEGVTRYKQLKKDLKSAEVASKAVKKAGKLMKRNAESVKAQKAMNRALDLKQQFHQVADKYKRERQDKK